MQENKRYSNPPSVPCLLSPVSCPLSLILYPLLAAALLLSPTTSHAEGVEQLPTEIPLGEPYGVLLASHPEITVKPLPPIEPLPTGDPEADLAFERPPGAREGVFQYLTFEGSWLSRGGGPEALGASTLETTAVFGIPFFKRHTPLLIRPGFSVNYLSGPQTPDLPPRVYDAYIQFRRLRKLSKRWATDLSFTPGVYSDFEQSTDQAFRLSGHFGAMFNWTERFDVIIGVAYLPYQTLRILPFAGFSWRPTDDWKIDLTVPRPMIARRISRRFPAFAPGYEPDLCGDDIEALAVEDWIYIAGELGGGSWAIRRANDENDVVTYRDLRFILGYERKNFSGLDYQAEIAYVFCRKYDSPTPAIHPGDSIMLRLGTTY